MSSHPIPAPAAAGAPDRPAPPGGAILALAREIYPERPSYAYMRACLLDRYARLDVWRQGRIADIGCGDGRFGLALARCGLLRHIAVGIEPAEERLAPGAERVYGELVTGSAQALPLPDGGLAMVLCNTVLNSLREGPDALPAVLLELRRVLAPGGVLVASMSTSRFAGSLLGARLLAAAGLAGAARAYIAARERGHTHHVVLSPATWCRALEAAGFVILETGFTHTPAHARATRLLRGVQNLPGRPLRERLGRRLLDGPLAASFAREAARPAAGLAREGAYLVVAARRG